MLMLLGETQDAAGWLTAMLFESPGWPIAVLALGWMLLRVGGRRMGNAKMMRLSWVVLLLLGGLLLVSSLVTTKREELPKAMDALLLAIEDKQMDRFRERVLPEAMTHFMGQEFDRDAVEQNLGRVTLHDLKSTSSSVVFEGDSAAMRTKIRADGEILGTTGIDISIWLIRWQYVDGQWRVLRMRCEARGADALFND